jgi:hypothetical protein
MTEQRYLLTVFHQAGPDPKIQKGLDGGRDYFTAEELEKACWSMLQSGVPEVGFFHGDIVGHAQVVESYIYRGPDWTMTADDGSQVIVKAGDWLGGLLCDEIAWELKKSGRVGGVSIQGKAKRRKRSMP